MQCISSEHVKYLGLYVTATNAPSVLKGAL